MSLCHPSMAFSHTQCSSAHAQGLINFGACERLVLKVPTPTSGGHHTLPPRRTIIVIGAGMCA